MGLFSSFQRQKPNARAPRASTPQDAAQAEVLRVRARRRLIGAAVLVIAAVLVLPLVFESKPRPLDPAVAIDVSGRGVAAAATAPLRDAVVASPSTAASLGGSSAAAPSAGSVPRQVPAAAPVAEPPPVDAAQRTPSTPERPAVATAQRADSPVAEKVTAEKGAAEKSTAEKSTADRTAGEKSALAQAAEARAAEARAAAESLAAEKAAAQRAAAEKAAVAKAAAAKAAERLAQDKAAAEKAAADKLAADKAAAARKAEAAATASTGARFVVQVGAFADPATVRDAHQRLDKLGLRATDQDVDTPNGRRTRVRLGPFASRDEADRAMARLRAAGLPGAVLPL